MSRRRGYRKNDEQVTDQLVRATSDNEARIAITEEKLAVINEQVTDLSSPEWQRITQRYLPAELRRIEHMSRQEDLIHPHDPLYKDKQLIVHGQIRECEILIGRLSDLKGTQQGLNQNLVALRREQAKLSKKLGSHRKKVAQQ
jgi:hypothetical protein